MSRLTQTENNQAYPVKEISAQSSVEIRSDAQADQQIHFQSLEWVGMTSIQSAIKHHDLLLPTKLDLGVNLKSGYRGIHMSRLYQLHADNFLKKELTLNHLRSFLEKCISSQEGLAAEADLTAQFSLPRTTHSLKSGIAGFRQYPVTVKAHLKTDHNLHTVVIFEILYSSTCPQSSRLSKEFFQQSLSFDRIEQWLQSDQIYPATPHAQRSRMLIELLVDDHFDFNMDQWIALCEETLGTPVQTAVKKADEMEFARLNAENPMFCEDAVRKVAHVLQKKSEIRGFRLTAEHEESLHPHNATSRISLNF